MPPVSDSVTQSVLAKTIDVFILSHPHSDHFMGMFSIILVFTVKSYVSETLVNRSAGFQELQKEFQNKAIPAQYFGKGDRIQMGDGVTLHVLGPSALFLRRTSPNGEIGETGEFAFLNIKVEYKDFSLLLTGDS